MSGERGGEDAGFLARWSRRKRGADEATTTAETEASEPRAATAQRETDASQRQGAAHREAPARASEGPAALAAGMPAPQPLSAGQDPQTPQAAEASPQPREPAVPAPTLADVAALNAGDDISRFVGHGVDVTVKRAAFKKLFADPHYNIMDGLDTYIDDYTRSDPIPQAMLRQMNQSRFLGLFKEEEEAEAHAAAAAGTAGGPVPAGEHAERAPLIDDAGADLLASNVAAATAPPCEHASEGEGEGEGEHASEGAGARKALNQGERVCDGEVEHLAATTRPAARPPRAP